MSLSLKKTSSTSGGVSKAQKDIGATRLPQVNLLPTDVTEARNLKKLKAVLAGALVLVLVLVVALTAIASGLVSKAQGRVDAQNAETARLQSEQRKYAEVPVVLGKIDATEEAFFQAGMGDVHWTGVLDAVTATLPEDVEVRTLIVQGWDPAQGAVALSDPTQPGVYAARISLELVSATRPDVVELLTGLEELPSIASPRISSVESVMGEGDDVMYATVASFTVTPLAFSGIAFPKELR